MPTPLDTVLKLRRMAVRSAETGLAGSLHKLTASAEVLAASEQAFDQNLPASPGMIALRDAANLRHEGVVRQHRKALAQVEQEVTDNQLALKSAKVDERVVVNLAEVAEEQRRRNELRADNRVLDELGTGQWWRRSA